MYIIKTSELLSGKAITSELTCLELVKSITDDVFETKLHFIMAAFTHNYKIEFSFDKANEECLYIMVEEYFTKRKKQNLNIEFIDDIHILRQHIDMVKEKFKSNILKNNSLQINGLELIFDEGIVDSIYYFPKIATGNTLLND